MQASTVSEARSPIASDMSETDPSTSLEPKPAIAFLSGQPARIVEPPKTSTGTTMTTPSHSLCERCAADVTTEHALPQPRPTRPELPPDGDDYTRFLIIPKAVRADREPVLRADRELAFDDFNRNVGNTVAARRENHHPTVKPVDLMRHLVRLVTPPGGIVLDPFLGSGSTALAAELEGFAWVGIEKEPEYVAIAVARLNGTQRGMGI